MILGLSRRSGKIILGTACQHQPRKRIKYNNKKLLQRRRDLSVTFYNIINYFFLMGYNYVHLETRVVEYKSLGKQ